MTNILFLYENEMPTVSLMKEGGEKEGWGQNFKSRYLSVKSIRRDDLNETDVLVLIRPTEVLSYRVACWTKRTGRLVITFCDDDLYNAPVNSALDSSRVSYFRKTLALSDIVWSSSPRIAEKYKQYTTMKRSMVTDTTVREEDIFPHFGENKKVKIVYAAGPSHGVLFEEIISPILNDLYRKCNNCFSITFVGVHPELPELEDKDAEIFFVPLMPLDEYRKYMRKENFDIGLAPLHSDEFSKCKYFNKYLEYSMFGILGVYSETEPYTYVVTNRKNGLLVPNNPEDWLQALIEAIQNADLRSRIVENAQNVLRSRFSADGNKDRFISQIPELLEDQKKDVTIVCASSFLFAKIEYIFRYFYLLFVSGIEYFRTNGLQKLVVKVKAHIFHMKAFHKQN